VSLQALRGENGDDVQVIGQKRGVRGGAFITEAKKSVEDFTRGGGGGVNNKQFEPRNTRTGEGDSYKLIRVTVSKSQTRRKNFAGGGSLNPPLLAVVAPAKRCGPMSGSGKRRQSFLGRGEPDN